MAAKRPPLHVNKAPRTATAAGAGVPNGTPQTLAQQHDAKLEALRVAALKLFEQKLFGNIHHIELSKAETAIKTATNAAQITAEVAKLGVTGKDKFSKAFVTAAENATQLLTSVIPLGLESDARIKVAEEANAATEAKQAQVASENAALQTQIAAAKQKEEDLRNALEQLATTRAALEKATSENSQLREQKETVQREHELTRRELLVAREDSQKKDIAAAENNRLIASLNSQVESLRTDLRTQEAVTRSKEKTIATLTATLQEAQTANDLSASFSLNTSRRHERSFSAGNRAMMPGMNSRGASTLAGLLTPAPGRPEAKTETDVTKPEYYRAQFPLYFSGPCRKAITTFSSFIHQNMGTAKEQAQQAENFLFDMMSAYWKHRFDGSKTTVAICTDLLNGKYAGLKDTSLKSLLQLDCTGERKPLEQKDEAFRQLLFLAYNNRILSDSTGKFRQFYAPSVGAGAAAAAEVPVAAFG